MVSETEGKHEKKPIETKIRDSQIIRGGQRKQRNDFGGVGEVQKCVVAGGK